MCIRDSVDECAQALEVSCWIPLLRGKRAILAGDHKQLAPTVKCDDGSDSVHAALLSRTLFSRLMEDGRPGFGKRHCSLLLETQYRMHGDINDWASAASYEGRLAAAETRATASETGDGFSPVSRERGSS